MSADTTLYMYTSLNDTREEPAMSTLMKVGEITFELKTLLLFEYACTFYNNLYILEILLHVDYIYHVRLVFISVHSTVPFNCNL